MDDSWRHRIDDSLPDPADEARACPACDGSGAESIYRDPAYLLAGTMPRADYYSGPCAECAGTGLPHCRDCRGTGIDLDRSECRTCDGEGVYL